MLWYVIVLHIFCQHSRTLGSTLTKIYLAGIRYVKVSSAQSKTALNLPFPLPTRVPGGRNISQLPGFSQTLSNSFRNASPRPIMYSGQTLALRPSCSSESVKSSFMLLGKDLTKMIIFMQICQKTKVVLYMDIQPEPTELKVMDRPWVP